jgi:hypothetical protein
MLTIKQIRVLAKDNQQLLSEDQVFQEKIAT